MKTVQSERPIPALQHLAAEYRAGDAARRNARRLTAWRVKWFTLHGTWPDENARLAQTLAGWPKTHSGGWPQVATPHTRAEVVSLVDRRRAS
jgi:hypothetical protein